MKRTTTIAIVLIVLVAVIGFSYILGTSGEESILENETILGIDLKETSLFFAAIIIGLLDGFNPCAMWVLIYLITLASQLQDKKKMWMIVGIFLLASGILYFILLSGWLNIFLLATGVRSVMIGVGIFAMGMGIHQLYDFYKSGGEVVCDIGSAKTRKKTMSRIDYIMHAPVTITSIIATIGLAFAINAVEFLCSAGLPAVFAQLIAASGISTMAMYGYNLVYTLAFMLDDIIIFCLALFAMQNVDLNKYSGFSKLIGGIIMFLIGVVLIFFPGLLS